MGKTSMCVIFDPAGPGGLCEGFAQNMIAGVVGIALDVLVISAAVALILKYYDDWRLRKVRRRSAQLLWSCAMSGVLLESRISESQLNNNTLELTEYRDGIVLLRWSFRNILNFTQDHAPILPRAAFNHASELRAHAEFGLSLLDAVETAEIPEDRLTSELPKVGVTLFASNLDGTNSFNQIISLSNIGTFMLYIIRPICTTLGMREPPPGIEEQFSKQYLSAVAANESPGAVNPSENDAAASVSGHHRPTAETTGAARLVECASRAAPQGP
jgi:hypothetical protein